MAKETRLDTKAKVAAKKKPVRQKRERAGIREYFRGIKTEVKIDAEAAKKWLENGAQPTETVRALLKKTGVIE